ncbi:MAG: peptidase M28, partial [Cyanobium sp.]
MAVRAYLGEQLGALGLVEEHHFREGIDAGANLILKLPGQRPELDPLLVAAHYDGPLHSIGADDNASGLAALIELA